MFAYRVYGLGLHSEVEIPELLASRLDGPPDVQVSHGVLPPPTQQADEPDESWAERTPTGDVRCVFSGVGHYLIEAGRRIVIDPDSAADPAVVRHLLLGPVLAHLLWQRGVFTLHASVLRVGARTVGFVGVSGEGKSTTAAALAARGHPLVCDDVAALVVDGERLRVLPAFPRIRLYEDSMLSIGDTPSAHPQVHPHIDKRSKQVSRFFTEDVWLERLYVLETADALAITPLAPTAALMEILKHTYYAHQYAPLYGFPKHLAEATRVVERVAPYRLTRPKDLARLSELIARIEAHAAA
ncbi:MAG: hypothetical protein ABW252_11505 [Polyangiales bacterium]